MKKIPTTRKDIETSVRDASVFYNKKLKIQNFSIKIHFIKTEGSLKGYMSEPSKGSFKIAISNGSNFYQSLSTMAHEMIHVKQFTRGDSVSTKEGILWKGKNLNWIPYSFRPWEIEAFQKEVNLTKEYVAFKEYPSIPFQIQVDLYYAAYSHFFIAFIFVQLVIINLVNLWKLVKY